MFRQILPAAKAFSISLAGGVGAGSASDGGSAWTWLIPTMKLRTRVDKTREWQHQRGRTSLSCQWSMYSADYWMRRDVCNFAFRSGFRGFPVRSSARLLRTATDISGITVTVQSLDEACCRYHVPGTPDDLPLSAVAHQKDPC